MSKKHRWPKAQKKRKFSTDASRRRNDARDAEEQLDLTEEHLEATLDVRDLLAAILSVSTCPACLGFGVMVDTGPDGIRAVRGPCSCRVEAREVLRSVVEEADGEGEDEDEDASDGG